jgi:hypothetical protein
MTPEQKLALAKAKTATARARAAASTNLVEQVGTGTSEGIANMAGMPVDMLTKGINAVGGLAGMSPIQNPVGGSESLKGLLDPFMSDVGPQTAAQRIGRRVGQDVGSGVVAGPVAGVSSLSGMGLNAAADAASGLAGGVTREGTDVLGIKGAGADTINMIASLLAGGGVVAGAAARRPGPQAPSNEVLRAKEDELWDQVRGSNVRLTPNATQELKGNVSAKAYDMRMNPSLHGPEGPAAVDEIWNLPDRPSLYEVEEARRFIGQNTPAGYDKKPTARIMGGLKREVDDYLDSIPHPDAAIAKDARDVSRRRIASELLDRTLDRAERQAARANNGANVVNSQRQRIDAILNSPKSSASFKPSELQQMDEIVRGTSATNRMRLAGSISPTRGGAYAGGNLVMLGGAAGFSGGDPIVTALAATPGIISAIARQLGEKLTDQQITRLSATIRNGGVPVAGKTLTDGERAIVQALLANQAATQAPQ